MITLPKTLMNFNYFIAQLSHQVKLSPALELELNSRLKEFCILKGTYVLNPGEVCKHIYFVKSGFFRIFTSDGFEETTIDFAGSNHIAIALANFLMQKSEQEGIVCEENATVYRLSYYDWLALADIAPEFLHITNLVLQKYLLHTNFEKDVYRISNSAQKYVYLTQYYKGIANIVSQKHIASYLGITGPTLSNLLKEMLRKP